jgi:putative hemolysin
MLQVCKHELDKFTITGAICVLAEYLHPPYRDCQSPSQKQNGCPMLANTRSHDCHSSYSLVSHGCSQLCTCALKAAFNFDTVTQCVDITQLCPHESPLHSPYCQNGGQLHASAKYDYSSCSHCNCPDGWTGPDCSCALLTFQFRTACSRIALANQVGPAATAFKPATCCTFKRLEREARKMLMLLLCSVHTEIELP